MKMLLHICCGPCSIYPLDVIRDEGIDVMGYYYNPNIHPYTEWARRREALEQYAGEQGVKLIAGTEYQLEEFLLKVNSPNWDRILVRRWALKLIPNILTSHKVMRDEIMLIK